MKLCKRICCLLLALVLVTAYVPVPAYASGTVNKGSTAPAIIAEGTCGTNVNWVLTADGRLTISGTGVMFNAPWGSYSDQITSVEIEQGVSGEIANNAFSGFCDKC